MYITSSKQTLFLLLRRVSKFPFRMWFILNGSQVQAQDPIQPKPLTVAVVMGLAIKLSLSNQDARLDVCWPIGTTVCFPWELLCPQEPHGALWRPQWMSS